VGHKISGVIDPSKSMTVNRRRGRDQTADFMDEVEGTGD